MGLKQLGYIEWVFSDLTAKCSIPHLILTVKDRFHSTYACTCICLKSFSCLDPLKCANITWNKSYLDTVKYITLQMTNIKCSATEENSCHTMVYSIHTKLSTNTRILWFDTPFKFYFLDPLDYILKWNKLFKAKRRKVGRRGGGTTRKSDHNYCATRKCALLNILNKNNFN